MVSINLKKEFTEIISQITNGKIPNHSLDELSAEVEGLVDDEDKELYNAILTLAAKNNESKEYILELSKGNFNIVPPKNNEWISAYKKLQNNLNNLAAQIQRLSEGDLFQNIDYLGDMSFYLNKLIFKLQEKKLIERALKESELKFKTIIETSPDGITITNLEGKIEFVTAKIVSTWGYDSEDELIGKDILKLVDSSFHEKSVLFVSEVIKGNLTGAAEYLMVRKDGSQFYSEVNTNVLRDDANNPVGILFIERDVTQRKEIEELIGGQIEQLSKLNATKDKFFRIIAHDLKNPFNSLLGLSNILLNNIENGDFEDIQQLAHSVNESAANTYKLLENLLEWSLLKTNKLNPHSQIFMPSQAIDEVISHSNHIAKAKGIRLISQVNCDREIWADKDILKTVLRNLVSNALKFTNSGGQVTISTEHINNNILFVVSDNGLGIQQEYIDKLFKIDSRLSEIGTANETGTGLGLILCKEFVEKNKGKIWVESKLGKGSQFKFTVPLK